MALRAKPEPLVLAERYPTTDGLAWISPMSGSVLGPISSSSCGAPAMANGALPSVQIFSVLEKSVGAEQQLVLGNLPCTGALTEARVL